MNTLHSLRAQALRTIARWVAVCAILLTGCASLSGPPALSTGPHLATTNPDPIQTATPVHGVPQEGSISGSAVAALGVPISRSAAPEGVALAALGVNRQYPSTTIQAHAITGPNDAQIPEHLLPPLWERIRSFMAIPPLPDEIVNAQALRFGRSGLLRNSAPNAAKFLGYFVEEARRRGLPAELALLPYIESAFNPLARSPARAEGPCQFIPATGLRFGLSQSIFVDLRRDPVRCAHAMYSYLQENYARFQDWHLALAAYNAGEQAVARAVERNRQQGMPIDFLSLRLPLETRQYVPRLLGLARLVSHSQRFGAELPSLPLTVEWRLVALPADIDVARIIEAAGISANTFYGLNPAVKGPVVPQAAHPAIALPSEVVAQFEANIGRLDVNRLSSWQSRQVNALATVEQLAQKWMVRADLLRTVNQIPSQHKVLAGSTLTLPKLVANNEQISAYAATEAYVAFQAPVRTRTVKVLAGSVRLNRQTGANAKRVT